MKSLISLCYRIGPKLSLFVHGISSSDCRRCSQCRSAGEKIAWSNEMHLAGSQNQVGLMLHCIANTLASVWWWYLGTSWLKTICFSSTRASFDRPKCLQQTEVNQDPQSWNFAVCNLRFTLQQSCRLWSYGKLPALQSTDLMQNLTSTREVHPRMRFPF